MKLAIIFWFYKKPEICENRLQLLKKYNLDLKVYGLYGGKKDEADKYKAQLGKYLDDFYISPYEDEDWKWINGDLMLLDWYQKIGKSLEWDSVAIVQWDMLVFDSIKAQFKDMKKEEIYLSGARSLDKEVEEKWDWTQSGSKERENYIRFIKYIEENYQYKDERLCCLFIFEIFPRKFFEKYLSVTGKEIGMLEYKIPIYSKIFGIPFFEKELGVRWFESDIKPLNAIPEEIPRDFIESELSKENGFRIFHPYFEEWNKL
jgi:hypothetical protein